MSAVARIVRMNPLLFAAVVVLQTVLVVRLASGQDGDAFGVLVLAALVAPVAGTLLAAFPGAAAVLLPLLVVVPGHLFGIVASQYAVLAVLGIAGLRAAASGVQPRPPRALEGVFLVYLVWAAISVSQAVETRDAVSGLIRLIMFFLAFLAGSRVVGSRRALPVIRAAAAVAILVVLQLLAVLAERGFSVDSLVAYRGAFTDLGWGHSNYVAAVAALSAAAGIPLALHGRGYDRFLGVGSVLAAALVATLASSRGGTLALAIGLGIAAVLEFRRRPLFILTLIGAASVAFVLSPAGQATLHRFANPSQLLSVGARFVFWKDTLRIAGEHPVLGIGPNQLPFHTHFIVGPNPHNVLLKNVVEHGVPGLILYVMLLGMLVGAAVRFRKEAQGGEERAAALALALFLGVGVANSLYEPALVGAEYGFLFWLVTGALYARSRRSPGEHPAP